MDTAMPPNSLPVDLDTIGNHVIPGSVSDSLASASSLMGRSSKDDECSRDRARGHTQLSAAPKAVLSWAGMSSCFHPIPETWRSGPHVHSEVGLQQAMPTVQQVSQCSPYPRKLGAGQSPGTSYSALRQPSSFCVLFFVCFLGFCYFLLTRDISRF